MLFRPRLPLIICIGNIDQLILKKLSHLHYHYHYLHYLKWYAGLNIKKVKINIFLQVFAHASSFNVTPGIYRFAIVFELQVTKEFPIFCVFLVTLTYPSDGWGINITLVLQFGQLSQELGGNISKVRSRTGGVVCEIHLSSMNFVSK